MAFFIQCVVAIAAGVLAACVVGTIFRIKSNYAPYPKTCELCGLKMADADDAMWWHGYGNCVDITDEMLAQWIKDAD